MDLGTGDGRLPWVLAHQDRQRFFVGLDANAANLRELSGRAERERLANLLYARAAVENLPAELAATADQVTVVLPWGSLLAAVAVPSPPSLRGIRGICQPGARLSVVLGCDPARDRAELLRLGIPSLSAEAIAERASAGYADAGFELRAVRTLEARQVAQWPSSWARRLARGDGRAFVCLEAVARSAGRAD